MNLRKTGWEEHVSGSGQGLVVGSFESDNEPSDSINRWEGLECANYLSTSQDSATRNSFT